MFSRNAFGKADEFMRALDSDDVLEGLGLMRKSDQATWVWPMLGGLGFGLLCGVAVGFSFAPKRGADWRGEVAGRLKNRDFRGLSESVRSGFAATESVEASTTPGRRSTVI